MGDVVSIDSGRPLQPPPLPDARPLLCPCKQAYFIALVTPDPWTVRGLHCPACGETLECDSSYVQPG